MLMQQPAHPLIATHLRAKSRRWSDRQRECALSALNRFAAYIAPKTVDAVSREDCENWLDVRHGQVSSTTVHKDWQHLRWFYKFLVDEEEFDADPRRLPYGPMTRVDAPQIADTDPARTGHITAADYQRLMATFGRRTVADCRDAAICSLMYWTGLRQSEVVRLDRDRIDLTAGVYSVVGKNGKWRTFALADETVDLLERYLRRLDAALDGQTAPVALFASVGGNHREHYLSGRMQPHAIYQMLQRRAARAGVSVTSHQFRRAMAINGKRRGLSTETLQKLGGWDDPRMIARYTRAEADALAIEEFRASDPTAGRRPRRRRRAA